MASFSLAPCLLFLLFFFFIVNGAAQSQSSSLDFVYNGFNRTETNFILKGATIIKPSGALKLTNRSRDVIGHAFYPDPINLLNSSNNISSFSTSFTFALNSSMILRIRLDGWRRDRKVILLNNPLLKETTTGALAHP
ncbi:unnamed protein product, partial [Vitis vinifera]